MLNSCFFSWQMPGIILLYYLKKGKITDPTAFYPAFYFAGGQGVLEMGNGTAWVWDMPHFGGRNGDRRKFTKSFNSAILIPDNLTIRFISTWRRYEIKKPPKIFFAEKLKK